MASSVLSRIFQKLPTVFFGTMIYRTSCQKSANLGGYRMMSTKPPPSRMSPWLMLPPKVSGGGGGGIVYEFYSLAEKKVFKIDKRSQSNSESKSPPDDSEFVGSSHGWIALFDRRTTCLFLSDPLTRRHIQLPQIASLPERGMNARIGRANVSKVILSSSPYDQECRAMMTFGPANRLAFCSPAECAVVSDSGRRHKWTPIGDLYIHADMEDEETTGDCAQVYEDLVYCKKRKVFSTMTPCEFEVDSFKHLGHPFYHNPCLLEKWDTWNPSAKKKMVIDWLVGQRIISVEKKEERERGNSTRYWVKKNKGLLQDQCVQIPHLVYADHSDQLYIALRFVMLMNPHDATTPVDRVPLCPFRGLGGYFPSKTVGFVLLKLDSNAGAEIVDDLDGLAMFVGINHSFALPASDFPELEPNSIYFTDSKRIKRIYGRDDIGIFDYQNKTVAEVASSDEIGTFCSTPPATGLVMSSPMWFNPTGYE